VMTRGMPSGVPPGVYVTPEVALTQQYVNRESQMIPGGMPSGIPPSVCLPADALCQPYVNNNVMKSQVAHTDMMRYSSKIPAPVESVRYFVPNTCSPVNAREPAPSYTQSQSEETCNSDERSEADSGIGYMFRPSQKSAMIGSRNAERSVRAYNSEVQANIVSTKGSSATM